MPAFTRAKVCLHIHAVHRVRLCSSLPPRSPWQSPEFEGLLVETSRKGLLSLNGFLATWAVTTAADPRRTLAYAYYLGWGCAGGAHEGPGRGTSTSGTGCNPLACLSARNVSKH